MTNQPKFHLCVTRYKDGDAWHTLLIDGKYWVANTWELECIKQGRTPEELGMFAFTDEELDREHE